jgi:uncharacterized protein
MDASNQKVFHEGERSFQQRLHLEDKMAEIGSKFIRPFLLEQHRDFFEQLPFVFVGRLDDEGHPQTSCLNGPVGFISSTNDTYVSIQTETLKKPAFSQLKAGQKIALLGIELHTRRRNRLNGLIETIKGDRLNIAIEQSFGNCPKYIAPRHLSITEGKGQRLTYMELTPEMEQIISQADVFFISSRTAKFSSDTNTGIDVSHRGGETGFVKIKQPNVLSFLDLPGNRFFNTLGNIQSDPRVGLLFFDFDKKRTLQISGLAETKWTGELRNTYINVQEATLDNTQQVESVSS